MDTAIAAYEAKHQSPTAPKRFSTEITRGRDRAEISNDEKETHVERLEVISGKRIAALDAVEAAKATVEETGLCADRSAGHDGGALKSPVPERAEDRKWKWRGRGKASITICPGR